MSQASEATRDGGDNCSSSLTRPVQVVEPCDHLLDQRLLPTEVVWRDYTDFREVARAITDMVVRGAPAIGCTAAYGVALGARQGAQPLTKSCARSRISRSIL